MRKLSILLFVLVMSLASFGQAATVDSAALLGRYTVGSSGSLVHALSVDTAGWLTRSSQFEIRRSTSGAVIKVSGNGDLYVLPSIVCDCDKCRSYKTLKFIYNIYTNKK